MVMSITNTVSPRKPAHEAIGGTPDFAKHITLTEFRPQCRLIVCLDLTAILAIVVNGLPSAEVGMQAVYWHLPTLGDCHVG